MTSAIKDQLNVNKTTILKNLPIKRDQLHTTQRQQYIGKCSLCIGTKVMSQKAVPNWSFKSGQTNMYEDES